MRAIRFFSLVCLTLDIALVFAEEPPAQPNIVVVMSDDHGQWATGAYGFDDVDTPNIDWLAAQGVRFENSMSPAPVCSPARASFYTGKMPSQHGVHDFLRDSLDFDAGWLKGETLLSQRLRKEGYRTALIGKWHATTDGRIPQPGFDRWLSHDAFKLGWQSQYLHSGTVYFSKDAKSLEYTGVQARFLTEEAIHFIDESSDQPFFISLNLVEPHSPFAGLPERLVSKYRGLSRRIVPAGGSSQLPESGASARTPGDHDEQFAQYLAAVNLIDEQVGRLLDALQGRGLLDNTIVVYTSDHGLLMGQYGLYGKTNATSPPNFYEETIRIPLIVYGPERHVRRSQVRSEFVDLLDLHTTILDFATTEGVTQSDYGPGRSMRPLLSGKRQTGWRDVQFAERGYARMVTDGRWKLVRIYHRDPEQPPTDTWYDLAHPFGEMRPSDGVSPVTRERLTEKLQAFFNKYETPDHSGRNVWQQPPQNPLVCKDLEIDCPK